MSTFTPQTGNFAYEINILPRETTGSISFGFEKQGAEGVSFVNPLLQQVVTGVTGFASSLSTTYQYTIVGNPQSGRAEIYYHLESGLPWAHQETITGAGYSGENPRFGEAVKISESNAAYIGAPYAMVEGVEERGGVAVVSSWETGGIGGATGSKWGQEGFITGSPVSSGRFGSSVDVVSTMGNYLGVGAPGEEAVYIFKNTNYRLQKKIEKPNSISEVGFGARVKMITGTPGNGVAVGTYESGSGSIAIFGEEVGGGWGHLQTIYSPHPENGDLFGSAFDIESNTLAVGAPNYTMATQSGSAYIYVYDTEVYRWRLQQTLAPSSPLGEGDRFGKNLAMNGGTLGIASNAHSGSVHVFTYATTWTDTAQVSGSGALVSGAFGGNGTGSPNIGIYEDDVLIGTTDEDKFYYFTKGPMTGDAEVDFSFSGQSGKFYDNDGNYVMSYLSGEALNISGNVFSQYHNYFINGVLTNSACSRSPTTVNSYYLSGTGGLASFYITVNA